MQCSIFTVLASAIDKVLIIQPALESVQDYPIFEATDFVKFINFLNVFVLDKSSHFQVGSNYYQICDYQSYLLKILKSFTQVQ